MLFEKELNNCDSVNIDLNCQLDLKDKIISGKDSVIVMQDSIASIKDTMYSGCKSELKYCKKKITTRNTIIKIQTGILVALVLLIIF